jgi:hypothetical protein
MTPKQEQEKIKEQQERITQLEKQLAEATKRAEELEKQKPASKSRIQATAALHLLEQGPVSMDKLIPLNPKYPSDPIYYVRTLLQKDVKRVKINGQSVYMLPAMYETYVEGLKKDKAAQEAATKEVKEEIPQAQATAHTQVAAH